MRRVNISAFSITFFCLLILTGYVFVPTPAHADPEPFTNYITEIPLSESERIDAIRFLQSRIIQPSFTDENDGDVIPGRYLVRGVRVLMPSDGDQGVFSYLVTYQMSVPDNRAYDLNDFYSVAGYFLVMITRSGDEFEIIDEYSLIPRELVLRLDLQAVPPPPALTPIPGLFDFTDAVFDAMDPDLIDWRAALVGTIQPRMEWRDLTGDGYLDCVLDIEGFVFHPTSYYIVLVSVDHGFIEGFRSWGFETDFKEIERDGTMILKADRYSLSANGNYLMSWRDFYIWNGVRYIIANLNFSDEYDDLTEPLVLLANGYLNEETSEFDGMSRYAINLTRFASDSGIPTEFYYNLARIEEYQVDTSAALTWWTTLKDYLDGEYDSQADTDYSTIEQTVLNMRPDYEDWRDQLYSAAEAALAEN